MFDLDDFGASRRRYVSAKITYQLHGSALPQVAQNLRAIRLYLRVSMVKLKPQPLRVTYTGENSRHVQNPIPSQG